MEQYVAYRGVWCQVVEHGWRVKDWVSPETGQREVMAWKKRCYFPQGDPDCPEDIANGIHVKYSDQTGTVLEEERLERQRQRNKEKSASRAKRTCRHKIKHAGLSSLLTCTYRENMKDFDRIRADWASMLRKLSKAMPWFSAVYAFEEQTRGAWHVHAAIDKLPSHFAVKERDTASPTGWRTVRVRSFDYIRRLWRSIVGQDNGNIDVDGHRRGRSGLMGKYRAAESLAKLAGYVSKYLTKDHATGPEGRNRWGSTQGIKVPKPTMIDLPEMPLDELIELAFHVPDGHRIVGHRIGQFGKFWALYTEPGNPEPPGNV